MRIVVSGYHGFGNLGDEAILTVLVQGLRDLALPEELNFTVLSADPRQTSAELQVDSVPRKSLPSIWRALKGADALVSGGGSLLQDSTSRLSPWYYLGIIWMAFLLRKPVYVFGQGMGPIRTKLTRWMIVKTLERVQLILLRDQASCDRLRTWGLRRPVLVYPDPAFLLFQARPEKSTRDAIALNLRPWPGLDRVLPVVARVCDRLVRELGCDIVYIPMQGEIDLQVGRRLQEEMEEPISLWESLLPPAEVVSCYQRMRVALGMRLHHLIFASCAGRPWVGIGYDPKLKALGSQMGEDGKVVPWEEITCERLWAALQDAWQRSGDAEAGYARMQVISDLHEAAKDGLRQLYAALPWRRVEVT